jgi:transposase-like protein
MAKKEKSLMRQLIEERGIKDIAGVQALVKELTAGLIQEAMDAELEEELGYSKYDYKNKQTENSRNSSYKKTVSSSLGDIELSVPRDRNGEYEPQIVKKHQMDISDIEDKIIFLYSQGTSTRDIEKTMQEMYGIEVDATRVSKITDKLLPLIREWQNRPLESVYAMVLLDAIHYKVREEGMVVKKAVYIAIGTDLEGKKDVLGLWVGATESSKYWLGLLNSLKEPGRSGYPDYVGRWADRVLGGHSRGLSPNRGAALYHSPNQKLHPVRILQGREGVYCGAKAHIQGAHRGKRLGSSERTGTYLGYKISGGHPLLA